MGELQTEYPDQANFNIIPASETAKRGDEIKAFGFEALKHGLVVFDAKGEPVSKLPGHNFGKAEIENALQAALPAN